MTSASSNSADQDAAFGNAAAEHADSAAPSAHVRAIPPARRIEAPAVEYRPLAAPAAYRAEFDGETLRVGAADSPFPKAFAATVAHDGPLVHVRSRGGAELGARLSDGWARRVALEYLFGHFPGSDVELDGRLLLRAEFFQSPALWLRGGERPVAPETWTETAGRQHPRRPAQVDGPLYRRYLAELGMTLQFRRADPAIDLERFHGWHQQPRVADLWDLALPKDELGRYLEKGRADPHQIPLILELDGEAAGYFEIYWTAEDRLAPYYAYEPFDRGFHFLIGERKFLGFDKTDAVLRAISHFLFLDDPRTRRIMAEPRADNVRVLRYVRTLPGWRFLREFDFPHKRAALLECRREVYFEERPL